MSVTSSKIVFSTTLLILIATSNSCSTLSYYSSSISGHLQIIKNTRPIAEILTDQNTSDILREKLQMSVDIRHYASDVLQLPENNSYKDYVDIGRQYVVWNIVATPEFSLEPKRWCYLIIGCLSYRGYFSRTDALEHARLLKSEGYDVYVAGVTAYSTLGWFDDPLINTMIQYDSIFLARVVFHELAHQLIYFKDDTEFNEAFADTVAGYGVRNWLQYEKLDQEIIEFDQLLIRESDFNKLVLKYKEQLEKLYKSPVSDENSVRQEKQRIFQNMRKEYEQIRQAWDKPDDYRSWFESDLNNAKISLVLTYKDMVPGFTGLLNRYNNDLGRFYHTISELEGCDKNQRRKYLFSTLEDPDC